MPLDRIRCLSVRLNPIPRLRRHPVNPDNRNTAFKVLLVGDTNLGGRGAGVLREHFADLTVLSWDVDSPGAAREADVLRAAIRQRDWDLCISFYNDLIFQREELARMRVPLNIHPATPRLPGVGHDTLPLIRGHRRVGATLHIMTPRVDSGPILEVIEHDLPPSSTRSALRELTQRLCLQLLESTAASIRPLDGPDGLRRWIESSHGAVHSAWSGDYVSRRQLRRLLDELKVRTPEHPVFR